MGQSWCQRPLLGRCLSCCSATGTWALCTQTHCPSLRCAVLHRIPHDSARRALATCHFNSGPHHGPQGGFRAVPAHPTPGLTYGGALPPGAPLCGAAAAGAASAGRGRRVWALYDACCVCCSAAECTAPGLSNSVHVRAARRPRHLPWPAPAPAACTAEEAFKLR